MTNFSERFFFMNHSLVRHESKIEESKSTLTLYPRIQGPQKARLVCVNDRMK